MSTPRQSNCRYQCLHIYSRFLTDNFSPDGLPDTSSSKRELFGLFYINKAQAGSDNTECFCFCNVKNKVYEKVSFYVPRCSFTGSPPKCDTLLASWYPRYMQSFIISLSSCIVGGQTAKGSYAGHSGRSVASLTLLDMLYEHFACFHID